ncbi:periplasmic copper-binding protein [Halococcus hamelinensis 100A6]|uniref:Periplasmic copper-binding protein n=1 Tax=Halococcus hamelinensis 100A6 TaxID=1132509 RepID=M0M1F1_9EURY|nr:periplasmic copper-binding protein [Halococcus hamelinensis 100A6]
MVAVGVAGVGGLASAQSTNDTTTIDSCRTIANDGEYALTADIEDSNRTVCVQILSDDVVFDGNGHTIDGVNASESVGVKVNNSLTGLSNVTVRNVTTTGWTAGVYYQGVANGSLEAVNASANARNGVLLRDAPETELRNVTAVDNDRWSLYTINSSGVSAERFETSTSTLSFVATDAALTGVESVPGGLPNRTAIDQHVGMAGTGQNATIRLTVGYDDASVADANVTENSLRLWGYDRNWSQVPGVNYVNTDRNVVIANVSALGNTSTFAPAGQTTTPTPTATRTATATATDGPGAAATGGTAETTTSDDGPGFGLVVAVVALLATALIARRRD